MNLTGDTEKVVEFMLQNQIGTDDLKNIKGLSDHDVRVIHGYFWKRYHANKSKA